MSPYQVREQEQSKVSGSRVETHRELVDLHLPLRSRRAAARPLAPLRRKRPSGEHHDVRLMAERDLAPSVRRAYSNANRNDPLGTGHRDRFHRDACVFRISIPARRRISSAGRGLGAGPLELDALIEVLGISSRITTRSTSRIGWARRAANARGAPPRTGRARAVAPVDAAEPLPTVW